MTGASTYKQVRDILFGAMSSYLLWTAFVNAKRAARDNKPHRVDPSVVSILTTPKPRRNPFRYELRSPMEVSYDDIA